MEERKPSSIPLPLRPSPTASPPLSVLVSICEGKRAPPLSFLPSSSSRAFSPPPRLFRTLRRYFFLADFLSRFLLTVLRRFPRKIMHS